MLNREEYNFTFDTDLTEEEFKQIMGKPVDIFSDEIESLVIVSRDGRKKCELMLVEESIYSMSYHELDDIRAFVRNHEWDDIPESIKEYLPIWEEFLAENL